MKNLPMIRNEKNNKLKLKEVKYNKNSKPNNNDEKLKRVALFASMPNKNLSFLFSMLCFFFFSVFLLFCLEYSYDVTDVKIIRRVKEVNKKKIICSLMINFVLPEFLIR